MPHYTYEDYCRWESRWEIIEGIAYAMSSMPGPEHQAVATNLAAELRAAPETKWLPLPSVPAAGL